MAQTQIFKGTARRVHTDEDTNTVSFFYHSTAIVGLYFDGSIRLNSGGYRTATTKLAMNQVANQYYRPFQVYQRKGDWFVSWKGQELPFEDGMILS